VLGTVLATNGHSRRQADGHKKLNNLYPKKNGVYTDFPLHGQHFLAFCPDFP
jgi:hypothetical protein